jgi:hypothetical protein
MDEPVSELCPLACFGVECSSYTIRELGSLTGNARNSS